MHMLCLITYKVRSENGYGFLRPGLKTVWKMAVFGLILGLDLEMRAAHPHQKFQGVPPGLPSVKKQKHEFHFLFRLMYNKTIITFGICDISRMIKVSVRNISRSRGLRLINATSILIILDITKSRQRYTRENVLKFYFNSTG